MAPEHAGALEKSLPPQQVLHPVTYRVQSLARCHHWSSSVPLVTNTAGPVMVEPCSEMVTSSRPPGTSTVDRPALSPAAYSAARTAATVPVPHERVSPTPRS